jgi:hypothetical protein
MVRQIPEIIFIISSKHTYNKIQQDLERRDLDIVLAIIRPNLLDCLTDQTDFSNYPRIFEQAFELHISKIQCQLFAATDCLV